MAIARDDTGKAWHVEYDESGYIVSEHEHWTLLDKIDRLRGLFDIRYVEAYTFRNVGTWSHPEYVSDLREVHGGSVSYSDVLNTPTDVPCRVYVDLSRVARGDDYYDQTSTLDRSNYRRLMEDYPDAFTPTSYSNVDSLGAYVGNLSEDLIETLTGLVTDYPAYDDSDMSELESEEITESWDQYVRSDIGLEIPEKYQDQWDDLDELDIPATDTEPMREKKAEVFWDACQASDYYPEHSGLDIHWDYDKIMEALIDGIETASAEGYVTSNPDQTELSF